MCAALFHIRYYGAVVYLRGLELSALLLQDCLEGLTTEEKSKGVALRVVSCCMASQEETSAPPRAFYWSVLVLHRKEASPRLKVYSLVPAATQISHLKTIEVSESWCAEEYRVYIPSLCKWVWFKAGSSCQFIGRKNRNKHVQSFFSRTKDAFVDNRYEQWLEAHLEKNGSKPVPSSNFLMSIVTPAFKTPPALLAEMIDSVVAQTYQNWELIIVNASPQDCQMRLVLDQFKDPRIKVIEIEQNLGIAGNTNIGIAHALGDYVSFLDHDDLLEPFALAEYVRAIKQSAYPVDLLYCDEDSVNEEGVHQWPLFKPSYAPDLLASNNYAIHWLTVSRYVLEHTTRTASVLDGAQDYDLTFKATEVARGICRVPLVLYHWRIHSGSTNANPEEKPYALAAGRNAIKEHFDREGVPVSVSDEPVLFAYRATFVVPDDTPFTIVCADEKTAEGARSSLHISPHDEGDLQIVTYRELANVGLPCDGVVLYLDGAVLGREDVTTLQSYFSRSEVAGISPIVYRQDDLIDAAGMMVAPDGSLIKIGHLLPRHAPGYLWRNQRPWNPSVLTPSCFAMRASTFSQYVSLRTAGDSPLKALAITCKQIKENDGFLTFTPFAAARKLCEESLLEGAQISYRGCQENAPQSGYDSCQNPNFDPYSPYYKLNWS